MIWRTWLALSVAIATSSQQPIVPRRDAAPGRAAPATVRGRVTSADIRQSLHRVRITLDGAGQNAPTSVTDTRGQFELTNVPAGSYTITATRAGYLTLQYGQR